MHGLETYLQSENDENKIVQCAITHYQFETIHPFIDGNGRVGRLLIVLQLIKQGFISAPLIYPSVFFERSRQEYYRTLQNVRDQGKWEDWIEYFTHAIISACRETIQFTRTIMRLRKQLLQEDGDVRRRASHVEVLGTFFEKPFLTVRDITDKTGLSHNAVQSALATFDENGLVYEITGKLKGRVYACRPVEEAIFGRQGN